jgi:hypothetical protein
MKRIFMKRKTSFFWLMLCSVIMFTMACVVTDTISNKVSNLLNPTKLDAAIYKYDLGGFSYKVPTGYDRTDDSGIVQILAPGGTVEFGPVYVLSGSVSDSSMTNEDLLKETKDNFTFDEFTSEKKISMNSVQGIQVDFSTTYQNKLIKGRFFVAMVTPNQKFVMLGGSPDEDWKTESKVFDKILLNVKFYTPNPNGQ